MTKVEDKIIFGSPKQPHMFAQQSNKIFWESRSKLSLCRNFQTGKICTNNQQIKRDRHRENENLVEFSIQLQWQTKSPVYKVAKESSQNTGS